MAYKSPLSHTLASVLAKILLFILRIVQLAGSVLVIAFYAIDLDNARREGKYMDTKWVYAVSVGAIGSASAIALAVPRVGTVMFGLDVLIFILYTAVVGIFTRMYVHENPEGDGGIMRMKKAIWFDLANMLLWFVTACWGSLYFFHFGGARAFNKGRARGRWI